MYEYRVYNHPIFGREILRMGFSWPALVIQGGWLLFNKMWLRTTVWLGAWILVIACVSIVNSNPFFMDFDDGTQWAEPVFVHKYGRVLIWLISDLGFLGLVTVVPLLLGFRFSAWQAKSLVNRGYELTTVLEAPTKDAVLAKLANSRGAIGL